MEGAVLEGCIFSRNASKTYPLALVSIITQTNVWKQGSRFCMIANLRPQLNGADSTWE